MKVKKWSLIIGVAIILVATACPSKAQDVYVVGGSTLWKNGKAQSLTGVKNFLSAASVYVAGNDVYIAGNEENTRGEYVATLWKNGVVQNLTDMDGKQSTEAHSVFVSGNDVYVVGSISKGSNFKGYTYVAMLWKNGVAQNLTDGKHIADATSVFVSGNDVYVAGSENAKGGNFVAMLWKNGVAQILTDGKHTAGAFSVYVSGNDVYVAGTEIIKGHSIAKLWKNGMAQNLTDGKHNAVAYSVYVSGNDVYVAGVDGTGGFGGNYETHIAKLWKNGAEQNLTDGKSSFFGGKSYFGGEYNLPEGARSVYVSGNDVYVVGKTNNAMLWKNGEVQNLTDVGGSVANSVFVTNFSGNSEERKLDKTNITRNATTVLSESQSELNKNSDEGTSNLIATGLEGVYKATIGKKQITFSGNTFCCSIKFPLITYIYEGTFTTDMKIVTVTVNSLTTGKINRSQDGKAYLFLNLDNGILDITNVKTEAVFGDEYFRSIIGKYKIEK